MSPCLAVISLLALVAVCVPVGPRHHPPPPPPPPPGPGWPVSTVVDLGYARYQGVQLDVGITQWLGIRFAAPPVGDLRWRAPQPPPFNRTVHPLPATEFAAICVGSGGLPLSDSTNEDCLYLNVFAPSNATTHSKLPVWFFIQGGGYAGDEDQNFNATKAMVASNNSIVFVQINYRVGAFGFLASEKIRENGDLNVGLLDQRFGLQWVQRYIHLFGGDPEHVVIHGDSAGAASVSYQMTAYGGRDDHLFVGGMIESVFWPTHRTISDMEFQFDRFAANVSCGNASDVLACLRSLDTATLQASDVASTFPGGNGTAEWYWLPVVDGTFSPDYMYNLFEQGKVVPVPVIVGDVTDEGTSFAPNATSSSEFLQFIKNNYPKLSKADLDNINEAYPEDGFGSFPPNSVYFPATESAYGESTLICPGNQISTSLALFNSPAEVWNYRYNVLDQENIEQGLGVPHVFEQPAIFGTNLSEAKTCDGCSYETYNAAIIPIFMDYWISFILSLNPNTYKNPAAPTWDTWTSSTSSAPQRLKVQTNATEMEPVPQALLQRCEMWKSLADVMQQ